MAYGALAALMTDRDRARRPTITPEAKAWLVSLACDKAKGSLSPHELWTATFGPPCARARTGGSPMSRPSGSRHRVQASPDGRKSSRTRCATSGTPRRRVRAQDGGSSVSTARSGPEKSRCQGGEIEQAMIVSYDEKPGSGHRHDGTSLPPVPGRPCELRAGS